MRERPAHQRADEFGRGGLPHEDYAGQPYDQLKDRIAKYFPEHIAKGEASLRGLETDMATLVAHPLPRAVFVGMEAPGEHFRGKENAGATLLDAVKEATAAKPVCHGFCRRFSRFPSRRSLSDAQRETRTPPEKPRAVITSFKRRAMPIRKSPSR